MKKKMDTVRVQITLSADMASRVDAIAEKYGVNRSAYLATIVGQSVTATEQSLKALGQFGDSLANVMTKETK